MARLAAVEFLQGQQRPVRAQAPIQVPAWVLKSQAERVLAPLLAQGVYIRPRDGRTDAQIVSISPCR